MNTALVIALGLSALATGCSSGTAAKSEGNDSAATNAGTTGTTGAMGTGPTSAGGPTSGTTTSAGSPTSAVNTGDMSSTTGASATSASSSASSSSSGSTTDAGASSGGSGGTSTGTESSASTTGGDPSGTGSPGCGSQSPLESGTFTLDVDGTERTYILDVPASYDTSHPYRLVFTWHWLGGNATDVVSQGYYGLKELADDTAIFVSPDGLLGSAAGIDGKGWYNTGGGDMKFLEAMLDHFNQNACIDQGRIFSTGFSFGGMMSNAIGCEKADVFRAIAPMSGNLQGSGCNETTDHPIAYLGIHGDNDTFVTTDTGRTARDAFVARNHCQTQTEPSTPEVCVSYTGCDEGYPVSWCEWAGGHSPWPDAAAPIWEFFQQF